MHVMYLLLTLIIVGICSVSNAQNLRALDGNNGFQNYKFGMHINQFQNCNFQTVEDGGAESCTIRRTHFIGDIETTEVELFFVDSKLSKIKVNFNEKFSNQLKEAVISAFGSSTSSNVNNRHPLLNHSGLNDHIYIWKANNITLSYKYRAGEPYFGFLYLEFSLNNYEDLLRKYRSKKYTPNDF